MTRYPKFRQEQIVAGQFGSVPDPPLVPSYFRLRCSETSDNRFGSPGEKLSGYPSHVLRSCGWSIHDMAWSAV